eukprot:6186899-Prymnesium_polylepis.1
MPAQGRLGSREPRVRTHVFPTVTLREDWRDHTQHTNSTQATQQSTDNTYGISPASRKRNGTTPSLHNGPRLRGAGGTVLRFSHGNRQVGCGGECLASRRSHTTTSGQLKIVNLLHGTLSGLTQFDVVE